MGEVKGTKFEPDFNRSVKVEFSDHRISSNAGVLLLREADFKLELTSSISARMIDTRNQAAIRYQLGDLLRERLYAMAMGYSTQDDVDRLAHDPAFRIAVWNRSGDSVIDERLASQPTQSRLLTMMATHRTNVNAMRDGLFQSVYRHIATTGDDKRVRQATIDLDSFPIEVFMVGNKAATTTVTIGSPHTIRWWPASRWRETMTVLATVNGLATVLSMRFCGRDQSTLPKVPTDLFAM